ncbi:thiolase family protein [Lapidilactobacillus mulanensis]|uniref:acetyl-CoA C-acetyltransferase n=1 Tax=Lapidilactobacillus mulanensis TaxID=2485999 RepID=A0ABW4DNA5_9LACO|nr:thiolase family protein [Lapidilactobacillus mulanensis]
MEKIVIVAAKRTPIGKFRGQFKEMSAVDLGVACLQGLLTEIPAAKSRIDQVLIGNVLGAGLGQDPARQVAIRSGLENEVTATTINDVCGSSLKALHFAQLSLLAGEANVIVAGGIESMSNAPLLLQRPEKKQAVDRQGVLTDSLFEDGLTDAMTHEAMGKQIEEMVANKKITREQQDEYALHSQQKAAAAIASSVFTDEIVPIEVDGEWITRDESVRSVTSLAGLASLRTSFDLEGTITAGNASPLNDGASMVLLTTETFAHEQNWPIMSFVGEFSEVGVASPDFGVAPIQAVKNVLASAKLDVDQIDLFELNEAFAAQAIAVCDGLKIPEDKLNISGGAIALGHPLGATGTRLIATLVHEMQRQKLSHGLATLCIGGGQGIAVHLNREGLA